MYLTVRRQVGKGIWIKDYKKGTKEDRIGMVDSESSEDSMELLKKEIKYKDNL
mgnify:CR=1 FL=1